MDGWQSWLTEAGVSLYIGLFILLVVEEAGVPFPLPGYAVLMYLGFRAHEGSADPLPVLVTAILAVTSGSCILYGVAHAVGRPLLARFGRFGRAQTGRIDTVERWFERRGILVVVVGRLIPNLRNPTSLAAGFLRLPPHVFFPGAGLAAILWSVGYFCLGLLLGQPGSIVANMLGTH
ncbi:MAG: DedA family protein [Bacteroidetes bacterium]|nr:DedA family protein [Bacteroidota bacterium]MCL5025181.1 DedA family protein [Chloroflexota bacterium]